MIRLAHTYPGGVMARRCLVHPEGVLLVGSGALWWPWGATRDEAWSVYAGDWRLLFGGVHLRGDQIILPHQHPDGDSALIGRSIRREGPVIERRFETSFASDPVLFRDALIRHEHIDLGTERHVELDPDTFEERWRIAGAIGSDHRVVGDVLVCNFRQGLGVLSEPRGEWVTYPIETPRGSARIDTLHTMGDLLLVQVKWVPGTPAKMVTAWDLHAGRALGYSLLEPEEFLAGPTPTIGTFLTRTTRLPVCVIRCRNRDGVLWTFTRADAGPFGKVVWTPHGVVCLLEYGIHGKLFLLDPLTGEVLAEHASEMCQSAMFWAGRYLLVEGMSRFHAFELG